MAAAGSIGFNCPTGFCRRSCLNPPPIIPADMMSRESEKIDTPALLADGTQYIYLPIIQTSASPDRYLDLTDRQRVVNYYLENYANAPVPSIQWDGNLQNCDPGTIDQGFQDATLVRLNFFRAMAGVPGEITFSAESNAKAQAAALMMNVNHALSHDPPSNWTCYSV